MNSGDVSFLDYTQNSEEDMLPAAPAAFHPWPGTNSSAIWSAKGVTAWGELRTASAINRRATHGRKLVEPARAATASTMPLLGRTQASLLTWDFNGKDIPCSFRKKQQQ